MTSFVDVLNGRTYYALNHPKFYSPGAKMLQDAQIMWAICLAMGLGESSIDLEELSNIKTREDLLNLVDSVGYDLGAAASCMQMSLSNLESMRIIANALEPLTLSGIPGW